MLERGDVANSWSTERWDSLRLLTPNWLSRLPDFPYRGPDPDGYMTSADVVDLISRFAVFVRAPVRAETNVVSVRRAADRYDLITTQGTLRSRTVILATGACNLPAVPGLAEAVPAGVEHLTPAEYRGPERVQDGGVLVVGGSATGVQLAAELQLSGRHVILSTGEHVRLPRTYRNRDILWWMHASGIWDQRYDEIEDLTRARRLPSPQLVGTTKRTALDLNALSELGVELVGRLAAVRDGRALFSGGLRNVCSLADLKLWRLLDTFDDWASSAGMSADVTAGERAAPTRLPASPRLQLDLRSGEIRTILWATGFRPDYRWLDVPVVDAKGQLRHDGGIVTGSPGLYALGLPVLRRRKSTFIHGIDDDAREVVTDLAGFLAGQPGPGTAPTVT